MAMTQEDYDLNYSALAADLTNLNTKYTALRLAVITSFSLDGAEPLEDQIRDYARVQREVRRNMIAAAVAQEREQCAILAENSADNFTPSYSDAEEDGNASYGFGYACNNIAAAIRARNGAK